jgi:hypothetical protein
MRIIDADKFLTWLVFSKHIEGLTCGEVKEAIEMCKVNVLEKIRAEIKTKYDSIPWRNNDYDDGWVEALEWVFDDVIGKYKVESEEV